MQNFFYGLFLLIFLLPARCLAQNLVPNPSFEEYYQCPAFLGSVRSYNVNLKEGILKDWIANPPDCTPDYYNACAKKEFGVPKNLCGTMEARTGEAYLGMILRIGEVWVGDLRDLLYREHVQVKLIDSLKKGRSYLVSMYVCLADYSNYAIGNIGMLLSRQPLIIRENIQYEPQVLTKEKELIRQKEKWVRVFDTLVAKGGEQYLSLGNFDNYQKKHIAKITSSTQYAKRFNFNRAYYYIDDVSVEKIQKPHLVQLTTAAPEENSENTTDQFRKGESIILQNVLFEFAKADLLPVSFEELDKVAGFLKKDPELKAEIIGHTDAIGMEENNQVLSEKRAEAVVAYLISRGVPSERLEARGCGESQPIDSNRDDRGRQQNRRVELRLK